MNSREKGAAGERELANLLQAHGYNTRRGQQFCGANGDADVVGLPGIHIECKRLDRLDALFRDDESAALKEYKQWIRDLINLCTNTQQAEELREAIKLLHEFCDNTYHCEKCSIKDWCDKYCVNCTPDKWEAKLWTKINS